MSFKFSCVVLVKLENFIVLCGSANLSKTLHINFYQSRSSIVEVMIKKLFFFMPHSVVLGAAGCYLAVFQTVTVDTVIGR